MTHISPSFIKETQNALEWLILSGITHEVQDQAGKGWKREEEAFNSHLKASNIPLNGVNSVAQSGINSLGELPWTVPHFNSVNELNDFCCSWKEPGLAKTAKQAVPGIGLSTNPRLMIISDMPEDAEDRSGIAFSASSNELINKVLVHAGYNLEQCYFTYLSKWRTPSRRNIKALEVNLCRKILMNEIQLIAPESILLLGSTTSQAIFTDSPSSGSKIQNRSLTINHELNLNTPVLASHKGEFLVKNPLMKKSFWFSLIQFAADTCSGDTSLQGTPVNNAESTATFT